MTYCNSTNQVGFAPRALVEYFQDYTLFLSTLSFCHDVRFGKTTTIPEIIPTQIYNLPSEKYKLKAPVDVILEKHMDEVLALLPELTLCGEGENEFEAINDLKLEILDLIEDLENIPEYDLGTSPKRWKQSLDLMVEKCL